MPKAAPGPVRGAKNPTLMGSFACAIPKMEKQNINITPLAKALRSITTVLPPQASGFASLEKRYFLQVLILSSRDFVWNDLEKL
jgi:hypothetical protein